MTDAPIVAVRGEATREVDPEIAGFSVTLHASDRNRGATLSRLAARVEALRTVLEPYAAAIEKRETSRLAVYARSKKERVIAYTGSATTSIVVKDLDVVGELMMRVADQDQVTVSGPFWSVRPGSPVFREVRQAAITEAITRAREYAEALGARLTALLELTDSGMSGAVPQRAMHFGARATSLADGSPELDLDPPAQQISAQVEARFAISEPTALAEPLD
jgi:uncharacterized protein YggE